MDIVLVPFLKLVLAILGFYTWMLIAYAILSWLTAFGIVNTQNQFVFTVGNFLQRLIEPALRPIRRIIPNISGIDLSLLGLFFLIYFIELLIERLLIYLL